LRWELKRNINAIDDITPGTIKRNKFKINENEMDGSETDYIFS
jgi:hypothetical protein